jgi:signal transduction histidine kinase
MSEPGELAFPRVAPGAAPSRTQTLLAITAAIARAVSDQEVYEALVDDVAEALGASSAGLWLLDEGAAGVRLVHSRGYAEKARAGMESLHLAPGRLPIVDALLSAEPVWISSQAALLATYPHLTPLVSPNRSYRISCLPLAAEGRMLGALAFTVEDSNEACADDREFLLLVASYASQAIERLRLLEIERRSRVAATAAVRRLEILGRAARAFMSPTLDLDSRLRVVVSELSAALNACINLSLLGPDGALHLVAVRHPDPEAHEILEGLSAAAPLRLGEGVTGSIAASGETVLLPSIDSELLASRAPPPYREFLARFPAYALIGAPLRVRGEVTGAVTATRCRAGETFDADDLQLLEDLADRAAVAVENGRLYQEALEARARAEKLYAFAQEGVEADSEQALFDAAANAIESVLGAHRSAILTLAEDGRTRFRAWRNLSEKYRSAVEENTRRSPAAGASEPVLVPDVKSDEASAALRGVHQDEGIRALASMPLVSSGQWIGEFVVYYDQPHAFLAHEVHVARAITSHLASAIARYSALAKLEQTVRYSEIFTGVLAHDLRNPLGAMLMGAHFAMERVNDDKTLESLRRIVASGARMTRMVDQLLDLTRARLGGGLALQREAIDLLRVANHAVVEAEMIAPDATIRVEALGTFDGEWDGDRMAQVFSNLLGNAVQHGTSEHPIVLCLDGRAKEAIEIELRNGGAIPRELLPRIFEPFRTTGHARRGRRGLGLGLYITAELVRLHGGQISVTSSEAEGTRFRIALPRAAVQGSDLQSASSGDDPGPNDPAPVSTSDSIEPTGSINPRGELASVLVIDDDVDVREALVELLVDRGYSVLTASNGLEALNLLASLAEPPSSIVLDLMMPLLDGYGVLEALQKNPKLTHIPVTVVSAAHGVERARLSHASAVLSKPIEVERLLRTLRRTSTS